MQNQEFIQGNPIAQVSFGALKQGYVRHREALSNLARTNASPSNAFIYENQQK